MAPYITTQDIFTIDHIQRLEKSKDLYIYIYVYIIISSLGFGMVSFHTPLSPTRIKMMPEFENLTKKRKWEESQPGETSEKQSMAKTIKPVFDTEEEPRLETPLPLEWQRCLDIKVCIIQPSTKTKVE